MIDMKHPLQIKGGGG